MLGRQSLAKWFTYPITNVTCAVRHAVVHHNVRPNVQRSLLRGVPYLHAKTCGEYTLSNQRTLTGGCEENSCISRSEEWAERESSREPLLFTNTYVLDSFGAHVILQASVPLEENSDSEFLRTSGY